MKTSKKIKIILVTIAMLVLLGSISLSLFLLFSNYQNIKLFHSAEENFKRGDSASLDVAEAQLLQLIRNDGDNEQAFIILTKIANAKKIYSEELYYSYQAYKLNPLSNENELKYIKSLCMNRAFERLENFLVQKYSLSKELQDLLLYAAGQNGNKSKYLAKFQSLENSHLDELVSILFVAKIDAAEKLQKLKELKSKTVCDDFLQQEIMSAMAEIYLGQEDFDNTEKLLREAYELNEYVFAPVLGRFLANYRSLGSAIEIFEKYLATYHDFELAVQCAELYCLTHKLDKIVDLRNMYQADTGEMAMLSCYYLDALKSFAENDIKSIKPYFVSLQKFINTPLATFIYLCLEIEDKNLGGVLKFYNAIINNRAYLDLQIRADQMVANLVKIQIYNPECNRELLTQLAEKVYERYNDVSIGKYLLISQKTSGKLDVVLLNSLLKKFPQDSGVKKIAIEYYLNRDLKRADKLIDEYLNLFPNDKKAMFRYEIISAIRKKDYDRVSQLFQTDFNEETLPEYWNFAINLKRINDLKKIAEHPKYKAFAQAAMLLSEGNLDSALDILAATDEKENLDLRFFAAKILGENNRIKEALQQYLGFPDNSVFQTVVLLNSAELYMESGNKLESLRMAQKAYNLAPNLPETQLCYADKLFKCGKIGEIFEVVKINNDTTYRKELLKLFVASMEYKIKNMDIEKNPEKLLNLCEKLLSYEPDNELALSIKQKIKTKK